MPPHAAGRRPRHRGARRIAAVLALLAAGPVASARPPAAPTVALTFDDLPLAGGASGSEGAAEAKRVNEAILAALARRHAPATGFVIDARVRAIGPEAGKQILREWLRHGQDLGNHTASHRDLNDMTLGQFRQEVLGGEGAMAEVLAEAGKKPRYLRFPYNHTGDTREKHDAAKAFLTTRGYRVAVCTIDNSDYEFARAYDVMTARRDGGAAKRLEAEYLAYTGEEIDYYSALDRSVFGREIPHVMLLHANRLNAKTMEAVLRLFETRGYRFVTLDEAQSDAAYGTADTFITRFGPMWGYRWAQERGVKVDGRLEPEPPAWVLGYGKN